MKDKRRLIPPFVMLTATAVVAVVTYLRDFPFDTWLVIIFAVMILFFFIGEFIVEMLEYFDVINERKAEEEAAKLAEEEEDGDTDKEEDLVTDLPPVK